MRVILNKPEVISKIATAHVFGATSHSVQATILDELSEIGFTSEKRDFSQTLKFLELDRITLNPMKVEVFSSKLSVEKQSPTIWIYWMFGRLTFAEKLAT